MSGTGATTDRAPLLGRESLVARLDSLLTSTRSGRGALLWLHGDAGIGKTRLLEELALRADDAAVLRGVGWEESGTPAFWLWTQVLRGAARVGPPEAWGARGAPARRLLEGPDDGPADDTGRFPLFDAVTGVLTEIAERGPLVLILDDLHWVDAGSLELLLFLTAELPHHPMLVACGWRDHDPLAAQDGRSSEAAGRIAARGESWLLGGLDELAVQALISATTRRPTAPAEARAVTARTGGNPLWVTEMARLARARALDSVTGVVPESAQATIRRRVARLAQPAERVLEAASVLGTTLPISRLGEVLAGLTEEIAPLVDDLVAAGLVIQDGDRLTFSHALVRDAVYEALAPARRRELHLRAARLAGPAAATTAGGHAELAHHLTRALPLVETSEVLDAAWAAARAAMAMQAYEEAGRWCAQALDITTGDSPQRPELLLLTGEAAFAAGDAERARTVHLEAAELARHHDDAELFARAALGFASGLAGFEVRLWDRVQADLLEESLTRLDQVDSALRAQALARLSVALSFDAPTDRRLELADEAVAMARRVGDARALAGALAAHCDAIAGPAYVRRREEEAGEIIRLARAEHDVPLELLGLRLRVVALLERGDLDAATRDMADFERLAERLRQPLYGWYVPLWRGLRAHLVGDLEEMSRCAEQAARIGGLGGSRNAAVLAFVQRQWPFLERGRAGEGLGAAALTAIGEMPELSGDGGSVIRLFPGQDAAVRRAALPLLPDILAGLSVDKEWLPNLAGVAVGLWEGGHGGEPARLVYDALLPWRDLVTIDGIGAAMGGSVEGSLALLATLMGRYDDAEEHFTRGIRRDAAIGATLAVANGRRHLAQMLALRVGPGDAARRRDLLGQALEFYRLAGIGERVEEVEAALREVADEAAPSPDEGTTAASNGAGVFRRDGAFWTVAWQGQQAVLPAVKGMADLAVLLERPEHEVHVLDLAGAPGSRPLTGGDLGEVIDDQARAAYRARLAEVDERLAEAEASGDDAEFDRTAQEREFLLAELGAAYGLSGRPRRAGDPAERARTTVTSRVRDAIGRIERELPELGRHLRVSVRTGLYCSYAPERPTSWDTRPTS